MKTWITEHLGHAELILPALVSEGLRANDRAKIRMSALQAMVQRAYNPSASPPDVMAECRAAGIDFTAIRSLILAARSAENGTIAAAGLSTLISALWDDVQTMVHGVAAGDAAAGKILAERLRSLQQQMEIVNDEIQESQVAMLTAVSGGADSLHRLVMDLHRALNRLASASAEETVNGARVYGLDPDDKPVVQAFMCGIDRTRALKFDHPGLDTTVTRRGSRIVIENDIGTTDAHVLIVTVEGTAVTVTHTDIHRARAKFFVALFDRFPVQWSGLERGQAEGIADEGAFYLITGRYDADTAERRDAFLEALGASLVFLIDWNKARKTLRALVDNTDAIRILDWAARHQVGHRAFLELGGGELVASAVRRATPGRIGFGEQLGTALGRDGAVDFLKSVLRISTEALLENRSLRLVRDEIEADLVRRLERTDSTFLAVVIRQAGLAREIAALIVRQIDEQQLGGARQDSRIADRASRIEEKADRLVIETRSRIVRFEARHTIGELVNTVEETIDELEQAAFIASLLPAQPEPAILQPLADLSTAVLAGAEAIASGVDAALELAEGQRGDFEDAVASTRRVTELEHAADRAERAATACVLSSEFDARTALAALELARALERAADGFAAAGNLLHVYLMADLSA